MRNVLVQGLKQINNDLIEMGSLIEIAIEKAMLAIKISDLELATSVKEYSKEVDELEKNIEHTCMQVLVSQQPVAKDLRLIHTALKLITDMRRIADQARDISEIVVYTIKNGSIKAPELLEEMFKRAKSMVTKAIDAFVNRDKDLAIAVINADDDVDLFFIKVRDELITMINQDKSTGEQCIDFIMIAKYLERIADHAVNIASWIIYYKTGRHYDLNSDQLVGGEI